MFREGAAIWSAWPVLPAIAGFPWMISYSASKAALIAYLEALRPGLARRGSP